MPICLLRHIDENVDLQRPLINENILTRGSEFEPLGKNFVRLRVPKISEAEQLIQAIKKRLSDIVISVKVTTLA